MNNLDYTRTLACLAGQVHDVVPKPYWQEICMPWFFEIAPEKNRQYGTECWERMGPKALLVDLSACYYRYKNLMKLVSDDLRADPEVWRPLYNAMVDHFGYGMIMAVMLDYTIRRDSFTGMEFDSPYQCNEYMLSAGWHGAQICTALTAALHCSLSMWESIR